MRKRAFPLASSLGGNALPASRTVASRSTHSTDGSTAKIIGQTNAGMDTVNSIEQAAEFGIVAGGQKLAGLLMFAKRRRFNAGTVRKRDRLHLDSGALRRAVGSAQRATLMSDLLRSNPPWEEIEYERKARRPP